MAFVPSAIATTTRKLPFLSAVVEPEAWLAALLARIELLPWVRPLISTDRPLTVAASFGERIVSFGLVVSRTYVTDFDLLLSVPFASTIEALKTFVPFTRRTPGIVKFAVAGIGTESRMGVGSWPGSRW